MRSPSARSPRASPWPLEKPPASWPPARDLCQARPQKPQPNFAAGRGNGLAPDGRWHEIASDAAWDFIEPTSTIVNAVSEANAFIFGSLVSRSASKETLDTLLNYSKFSVFDLNLRPPFYTLETITQLMIKTNMLKFNDDELYEIANALGSPYHSLDQHILYLVAKTNTPIICVTKGMHGAVLYHDGDWFYNSGYRIEVKDTVGAGDSFLATLVLGLLQGNSIQSTLNDACGMGALVASSKGANPSITIQELATFVSPI